MSVITNFNVYQSDKFFQIDVIFIVAHSVSPFFSGSISPHTSREKNKFIYSYRTSQLLISDLMFLKYELQIHILWSICQWWKFNG